MPLASQTLHRQQILSKQVSIWVYSALCYECSYNRHEALDNSPLILQAWFQKFDSENPKFGTLMQSIWVGIGTNFASNQLFLIHNAP